MLGREEEKGKFRNEMEAVNDRNSVLDESYDLPVDYVKRARNVLNKCDLIRSKHSKSAIRLRQGKSNLMQTHGEKMADSSVVTYTNLPQVVTKR